jgi:hypothetical protein
MILQTDLLEQAEPLQPELVAAVAVAATLVAVQVEERMAATWKVLVAEVDLHLLTQQRRVLSYTVI